MEEGIPIIDNQGWNTVPIHHFWQGWLQDDVQHEGKPAKGYVAYIDWRNAEAERDFKYESKRDFTKLFRALGTSTGGLRYEETATWDGFLTHLSPLGHERHYIAFQALHSHDLKDKRWWNCILQ